MNNLWADRFLKLAREVSTWSKDPSSKVGAVLVDVDNNVRAMGCNGFPRGIRDLPERFADRATKLKLSRHAESNTVAACARMGSSANHCTLYCTHFPCVQCAGLIVQSGIHTVVLGRQAAGFLERWKEDIDFTRTVFDEAGIFLIELDV